MRRAAIVTLIVLGAVFVALAVPASYLNRTVLDAPTFAQRVDELRQRDDVSSVVGREVGRQLVAANPDLVAIAPLVDQVSVSVVRSDLLSGPVRVAASQFHRGLTTDDSDQLILRVADVGAVVAATIGTLAPERVPAASNVAATLADVGSQQFASGVIEVVDLVDLFAWLLPVLALACFVTAVVLSDDRWDALRRVGWATVLAAATLAAIVLGAVIVVRSWGGDERADALVDGVWDVFIRPIWWPIALLATVGALLVLVGSGSVRSWSPSALLERAAATPASTGGVVARALAFIAVGLAAVLEPGGTLTVVAFTAGVLLVITGVVALSALAAPLRVADETVGGERAAGDERAESRTRAPLLAASIVGALALLGLVVWAARPPEDDVAGASGDAVAGTGEVCNGHAELCDRRFDEVSFVATHNSMSVADEPGWYLAEQGLDIVPQLDSGVRALLVDVWYGRDAGNGRVRTAARSYEEALAVANEELGTDIVEAALRVVDAVAPGEPRGPERLFMCHGLCETGATSFDDTLRDVRAWLATNPDEVLTIFVEDHVDAADVAASVEAAGLLDYLYTPVAGESFPTLGDMIRSGERLLVMLEERDGRPEHPWLVNGFEFVQETPYTFPTVESFSCEPSRGEPDAPLFQINHWLSGFTSLVSDAELVNVADVLGSRVEQCRDERDLQPTFVAVNFADIGDVVAVVDALNGVD